MINTDSQASISVDYGRENCFDMTKLIFRIMCVAVVKELLEYANRPGSALGDAVFCFFVPFFFFAVWSLFLNTIFPFGPFFLYSYC